MCELDQLLDQWIKPPAAASVSALREFCALKLDSQVVKEVQKLLTSFRSYCC